MQLFSTNFRQTAGKEEHGRAVKVPFLCGCSCQPRHYARVKDTILVQVD